MSVTIEPTVTPAPKPEWPELTCHICRDKYGETFTTTCLTEDMMESELVHLATVTIPSSADCERRAKVEAARERVVSAAKLLMLPPNESLSRHRQLNNLLDAAKELQAIEQGHP